MLNFVRLAVLVGGVALIGAELILKNRRSGWIRSGLLLLAVIQLLLLGFVVVSQLTFPLHLEVMEGVVLQHFQQAAAARPIFPEPSPAYVPLAYNVLYYYLAIPFGWLFGINLVTLRLVSLLGLIGCGLILFRAVQVKTRSVWWGIMTAGLFAAAYQVMDAYLNTAHSDVWFLLTALLGSYLIDHNRSRRWNTAGVILLVASFWFKQQGALFVVGGVLFLTWREMATTGRWYGLQHSLPYWLAALLLGPVIYLLFGNLLFGVDFHYFTWEVPRQWTEPNREAIYRLALLIIQNYLILGLASALLVAWKLLRERPRLNIWDIQLMFAGLTALLGSFDPGSSNNVFIPLGIWLILVGVLALYEASQRIKPLQRYHLDKLALVITFAVLLYDPQPFIIAPDAHARYDDYLAYLRGLNAQVYAPWEGQLNGDFELSPAAHWVALEDLIRGPGRDTRNHPLTRKLTDPAINPAGEAYLITNQPLADFPWMAFLLEDYVLVTDLGDRFKALSATPHRFLTAYPRYVFRYDPAAAREANAASAGS